MFSRRLIGRLSGVSRMRRRTLTTTAPRLKVAAVSFNACCSTWLLALGFLHWNVEKPANEDGGDEADDDGLTV